MTTKIFDTQVARKPNLYPFCQEYIDAMWKGHWTPNEFSFKSDIHDFKTELTEEEREIIKRTLSAIGQIEIAVKKFWAKLGDNLPHPSLTDLGLVMAGVEVIHNIAYDKLLDTLGLQDVFQQNMENPIIKNRVGYLTKYLEKNYADDKKQYIYSLILFTLFIENVSLFSQFYVVLWFGRYKNVLKDTNQQVLYTKNEEQIHASVGTKIINVIRSEYPELFDLALEEKVLYEARQAFEAESTIIDWIIGDYDNERINAKVLKEYIKNRINISLVDIGYPAIFEINEDLYRDFEWMNEEVLGNSMTDFFYKKPVDYTKKSKVYALEELF